MKAEISRLRVGVIGCGFISQVTHLQNLASNPKVYLVALADKRTALASSVARRFDITNVYACHTDMLETERLDAVVVVTRRVHTASVVEDCLRRGIPTFSEKPMAQTEEVALKLAQIAQEKNVPYCIGFMRRFDGGVRAMKNILESSETIAKFGRLLHFSLDLIGGDDYCGIGPYIHSSEPRPMVGKYPIAPSFLRHGLQKDYERFVNVCGHDINLIRYILDATPDVEEVVYHPDGCSTAAMALGIISGRFTWRVDDRLTIWRERFALFYEFGEISLELEPAFLRNQSGTVTSHHYNSRVINTVYSDFSWSFQDEINDFIDRVSMGIDTSRSSVVACLEDYKLIDSIWKKINRKFN